MPPLLSCAAVSLGLFTPPLSSCALVSFGLGYFIRDIQLANVAKAANAALEDATKNNFTLDKENQGKKFLLIGNNNIYSTKEVFFLTIGSLLASIVYPLYRTGAIDSLLLSFSLMPSSTDIIKKQDIAIGLTKLRGHSIELIGMFIMIAAFFFGLGHFFHDQIEPYSDCVCRKMKELKELKNS